MSRWKTLNSQELFATGLFRMRVDRCELPDGRVMPRYYVMEFPDWVNVLPIRKDGQVVLVNQYRHAAAREFLEIPGGSTHPGNTEDPRLAGERELLEETGYTAKDWLLCGSHFPNPAMQNNRLHTYIAFDCEKTSEQQLDPYEDLQVLTMDLTEVVQRWRKGEFSHSLIAASIGMALEPLRARGFKID
jgi:ADP-ribose pyrophosphatase